MIMTPNHVLCVQQQVHRQSTELPLFSTHVCGKVALRTRAVQHGKAVGVGLLRLPVGTKALDVQDNDR
jgi:hypothetical protein